MKKVAVYAGTRNVYEDIIPALKSLLRNGRADNVVILAEDDSFPHRLPENVDVINVTDYIPLIKDSVNFNCYWTYMVLLRLAYSKIFPDIDRIVSLDIDTIVRKDISELWQMDMTGYYYAGVKEPKKTEDYGRLYINAGVLVCNLAELREYGMDDKLIEAVNKNRYEFVEQDCISELCKGHILEIDPLYNRALGVTIPTPNPFVFHFAGHKDWQTFREIQYYRNMPWREVY